jgi:excisionase family DNA binding protein
MEAKTEITKPKWFSIQEAAAYLEVGEPTIYRWMRENRITFRKVGDSTRFVREDLDAMVQVFRSDREVDKIREVCPGCHHDELVDGHIQSTGLCYFRPKQTKFWTFRQANVDTTARMCPRCGMIVWFGDQAGLAALRKREEKPAEKPVEGAPDAAAEKPVEQAADPT